MVQRWVPLATGWKEALDSAVCPYAEFLTSLICPDSCVSVQYHGARALPSPAPGLHGRWCPLLLKHPTVVETAEETGVSSMLLEQPTIPPSVTWACTDGVSGCSYNLLHVSEEPGVAFLWPDPRPEDQDSFMFMGSRLRF